MPKYFYLLAYIIPVSTLVSIISSSYMTYTAAIVAFIILPSLEFILPLTTYNFSEKEEKKALNSKFYDFLVYSMVPVQYGLVLAFCYSLATRDLNPAETFGLIFSMGISCGVIGINVGHELGHRIKKSEQLMAKLLLATSWYSHFFVEHNKGHHRHVATPNDPASAIIGQNVYHFWFKSVTGSFISALNFEKKRLRNDTGFIFLKNDVYKWKMVELALTIIIGIVFGFKVALCFLGAALIGALLLECVNYIEHYGLRRKQLENGRYEKVTPFHSWNSDHPIGRLILFDLSRHSDHHANANRKYQILRTFDHDCPQFPTGYPGMILLSLAPPLWFKVMNKKVKRWQLSKSL